MNEPFSDEILSAYVDGELSPHERAEVERWMEASPKARQKIADFRRLSRLFGELSLTELPREFAVEVMHVAERRMLLPDAVAARRRRPVRGWVLALAGSTATAAVLLLTVNLSNRIGAPQPAPRHIASRTSNLPAPASSNRGAQLIQVEDRSQETSDSLHSQVLAARDEPRSAARGSSMAGRIGGALPPSAPPASPAGTADAASGAAARSVAAAGPSTANSVSGAEEGPPTAVVDADPQLRDVQVAVHDYLESGGSETSLLVVRLVVDRADGLILLQKDFADNDIRVDSRDTSRDKAKETDKPIGEVSHEGLYVKAQADELIAGFKTYLARQYPGARVVVERSIEVASLDDESQRQILGFDDTESNFKSDDAGAKARKKAALTDRKKSASPANSRTNQRPGLEQGAAEKRLRVAPPDDDASIAKKSEAGPAGNPVANNARQMVVQKVPAAIENRSRTSGTENAQTTRNLAGRPNSDKPESAFEAKDGDEKPRSQIHEKSDESSPALVRMLIVIEREPQQPDVPAAKKGPSGGAS